MKSIAKGKGPSIADQRISKLTKNRRTFFSHARREATPPAFSGPSRCLYEEVLKNLQGRDYEELLDDFSFIINVYATLPSWGMHRSGSRGPKMTDLREFRLGMEFNRHRLLRLNQLNLVSSDLTSSSFLPDLRDVFNTLSVMRTGSKLVGNSKTMHFLLPDLVPPIDREYTLRFFFDSRYPKKSETELFVEIMGYYKRIQSLLSLSKDDLTEKDSPYLTIPKLIDDAIIGFVVKEL